ncbi:MAG: response regulator [Rhodoferax sp.]
MSLMAPGPVATGQFDILAVDDSVENLRVIAAMLSQAGYQVRIATDGELALKSIARLPPTLVLLDVRMPGLDGFEVCRRIRRNLACAGLPAILLSAQDDSASRVEGFKAGAIDFIGKPFVVEEVLSRISVHLALWQAQQKLQRQLEETQALNRQLMGYLRDLMAIIEAYDKWAAACADAGAQHQDIAQMKQERDFDYLKGDIFSLLAESKEGLERVRKIVLNLRSFSHVGEQQWQVADLHQGIDSTLNMSGTS